MIEAAILVVEDDIEVKKGNLWIFRRKRRRENDHDPHDFRSDNEKSILLIKDGF